MSVCERKTECERDRERERERIVISSGRRTSVQFITAMQRMQGGEREREREERGRERERREGERKRGPSGAGHNVRLSHSPFVRLRNADIIRYYTREERRERGNAV